MTEIEIPFNAWSKKRLRDGVKFSTFRYKQYGKVGDIFVAEGKEWKITAIEIVSGETLLWLHHVSEGAESPAELEKVLQQICRGKFNPKKEGILHHFRPIGVIA